MKGKVVLYYPAFCRVIALQFYCSVAIIPLPLHQRGRFFSIDNNPLSPLSVMPRVQRQVATSLINIYKYISRCTIFRGVKNRKFQSVKSGGSCHGNENFPINSGRISFRPIHYKRNYLVASGRDGNEIRA